MCLFRSALSFLERCSKPPFLGANSLVEEKFGKDFGKKWHKEAMTFYKMDIKSYARKILNGSVKPSDDDTTFRILDSLLCKSKADKQFYFEVANFIQRKSDGSLAEYVAMIANKYYFTCTSEFISNSMKLSPQDLASWLDYVSFGLSMSGSLDLSKEKEEARCLGNELQLF